MAIFKNPNNPVQPQPGVYGWFGESKGSSICIYIGESGKRNSVKEKGTLLRGVTELQRDTFSTDSPNYQKLDTDFVVGTAIRYFETKGYDVFWEHVSNDPNQEKEFARLFQPVIQNTIPHIHRVLKIESSDKLYWKWPKDDREKCLQKLQEAEDRIFKVLDEMQLGIFVNEK